MTTGKKQKKMNLFPSFLFHSSFLLLGLLFLLPSSLSAQMRQLSFYEVRPRVNKIEIDGKIDESEWKGVPVHDAYYEYWKANPGPGALKTELRMVYDKDGIYIAVVNYDDNMPALRRTIREYDNGDLWKDDCGEFYIDPEANGIGFTKFVVNANGARYDVRRQDTAVYLLDWNGTGWKAAGSVGKDAWYAEIFIPWEDLNGVAQPGSIWQLCHARYSWTKKFRGMTSSPNANYNSTNNFGYLYFSDGKTAFDPVKIGNILAKKALAPWCIPCGNILVSYNGSLLKTEELTVLLAQEKEKCRYLFLEMDALQAPPAIAGQVEKVRKELEGTEKKGTMAAYRMYQSAAQKLFTLKWKLLINRNFN